MSLPLLQAEKESAFEGMFGASLASISLALWQIQLLYVIAIVHLSCDPTPLFVVLPIVNGA